MSLLELESGRTTNPWLRRLRNLAMAVRIGGMIYQPLPDVAIPVPPPPIVEVERKKKGSGSRESEQWFREMTRLGRLAAACRNEAEAEAYVGALPTLAAYLAPRAAAPLMAAAPRLSRGLCGATRLLRGHPDTRGMVAALPAATRNAALRLEVQPQPVTSDTCARILAEETVRVLRQQL